MMKTGVSLVGSEEPRIPADEPRRHPWLRREHQPGTGSLQATTVAATGRATNLGSRTARGSPGATSGGCAAIGAIAAAAGRTVLGTPGAVPASGGRFGHATIGAVDSACRATRAAVGTRDTRNGTAGGRARRLGRAGGEPARQAGQGQGDGKERLGREHDSVSVVGMECKHVRRRGRRTGTINRRIGRRGRLTTEAVTGVEEKGLGSPAGRVFRRNLPGNRTGRDGGGHRQ